MSIIWMDGFEFFGNGNGLTGIEGASAGTDINAGIVDLLFEKYWDATGAIPSQSGPATNTEGTGKGRFSVIDDEKRQSIRMTQSDDSFDIRTIGGDSTGKWFIGFGLQLAGSVASAFGPFMILFRNDPDNVEPQMGIAFDGGGRLEVYRGDSADPAKLLARSTKRYKRDVWQFIEIEINIGPAAEPEVEPGSVRIDVNGENWIDVAGINNQEQDTKIVSGIKFTTTDFTGERPDKKARIYYLDDVYVCDSAGAVNNGLLGDVAVDTLLPMADGDSVGFTVAGSQITPATKNWQAVDDPAALVRVSPNGAGARVTGSGIGGDPFIQLAPPIPQSGTPGNQVNTFEKEYVAADDPGILDLYKFTGLLFDQTSINGVEPNHLMRTTDPTEPHEIFIVVKTGSTLDKGSSQTLLDSLRYQPKSRVLESNPDTGEIWTSSELAVAQFGFEVES